MLGSSRKGIESRMLSSGFAVPRGGSSTVVTSDSFHTLSQCISLEPIVIPDQITWCDKLKRVLGISVGSTAEGNSLGASAAHVKDLKRFRLSVEDTCFKARVRANIMDEILLKLDKYCEGITSKKQKLIYSMNQRVEDRPKNILLNKRVRT